jgi:hypothetical protein
MIYFGKSSMCCWEECALCSCWTKYSVKSIWTIVSFNFEVSLLIFCLYDLSIGNSVLLRCSAIVVLMLGTICAFKSSRVCLIKLGALTFGAYMLTIVISSWWIVPFINMKWPALSLLNIFGLKSALSDMSIATPACFQGPFAWKIFFHPFNAMSI